MATSYTKEQIFNFLSEIPDPEIPVIDIYELGVLREINIQDNKIDARSKLKWCAACKNGLPHKPPNTANGENAKPE